MKFRHLIILLIIGVAFSFGGLILRSCGSDIGMIFVIIGLFIKFFGLFGMLYLFLRQKQSENPKSE